MKNLLFIFSVLIILSSCNKNPVVGTVVSGTENITLIPMQDTNGLWGYVDTTKTWIIEPQYADAWLFRKGRGVVAVDQDHYGVINSAGDWIIKPEYKFISTMIDDNQVFYYVDRDKGTQILSSAGHQLMSSTSLIGLYSDFSENVIMAMNPITTLYGFKNKEGEWVIKPQYQFGANFSDSLASVSDGKTRLFIDHNNNVVLTLPKEIDFAGSFEDGLAPARKAGKYGYIDKSGNTVIDFIYQEANDFSEGLALVYVNDSVKYINKRGEIVLHMDDCDLALSFKDNYANVFNHQKAGLIDKQGNLVIPMIYTMISIYDKYDKGYFRVYVGNNSYYIDLKGNEYKLSK